MSGLAILALSTTAFAQLPRELAPPKEVPPDHPPKVSEQGVEPSLRIVERSVPPLNGNWKAIEWPAMYKERYLERLDWRLGLLKERLSLSPDQQSQVATWREQVATRLDSVKRCAEADAFATPRELEAFLRPLLDEKQVTALAAFKQEEQSQCVASLTSRQFSCLEKVVGLKTEQQQEFAGAIAGEMQVLAAFALDDPRPLEVFSSNYDKDPQALGIEKMIWEVRGENGILLDREDPRGERFSEELGARIKAQIEARLASLKPLLTPEQLETYRQHLRKNCVEGWHRVLLPALDSGG